MKQNTRSGLNVLSHVAWDCKQEGAKMANKLNHDFATPNNALVCVNNIRKLLRSRPYSHNDNEITRYNEI